MNPPLNLLPPPASQIFWHVFIPYSWLHLVTVIVCAALIIAPVALGRALSPGTELNLRRALAAAAIAYWIAYAVWWNWSGLDWREGWPLQICDLNGLPALIALLSGRRWMRATVYYWTAALTPWPQRAIMLIGLVILGFVIVLLQWRMTRQRWALQKS
jgi:uncharacterized membrane protein YwaF